MNQRPQAMPSSLFISVNKVLLKFFFMFTFHYNASREYQRERLFSSARPLQSKCLCLGLFVLSVNWDCKPPVKKVCRTPKASTVIKYINSFSVFPVKSHGIEEVECSELLMMLVTGKCL